jgi:hypothetical protein
MKTPPNEDPTKKNRERSENKGSAAAAALAMLIAGLAASGPQVHVEVRFEG